MLLGRALAPGEDCHAAGRELAAQALAAIGGGSLAYDGTQPIVTGASISIAHTRTRVVVIAGPVARLGIDLVDNSDEPRVAQIAARYFAEDDAPLQRFAATEAALKAFGLGLIELYASPCPVQVSLAPPRVEVVGYGGLDLHIGRIGASTVAVAYAR